MNNYKIPQNAKFSHIQKDYIFMMVTNYNKTKAMQRCFRKLCFEVNPLN